MSQTTALAKARALKAILLKHGVPEVSIELMEGRPTSFGDGSWDSLFIVTNFAHHTVSSYSSSNLTPVLSLCKRGRTDVPGPLCNGYGGYDLCYRIITFGYANHPGAGGPYTINNFTIPKDSARRYAWGTEWEGGINSGDWDRMMRNPRNGIQMTMREMFGRAHAGIQEFFSLPRDAHMEHKTWAPTRKVDRLGYTRSSGITEITKYASTTPEDDMPLTDADAELVATKVWFRATGDKNPDGTAETFWTAIRNMPREVADAVWWRPSGLKTEAGADIPLWTVLAGLPADVAAVTTGQVDVEALATALAPKLNIDPTAFAAAIAPLLPDPQLTLDITLNGEPV